MKKANLSIDGIEFGTHLVSDKTWNGFLCPLIKEGDMESFAKQVYDAFGGNYESYDLIEFEDGKWVWNQYVFNGFSSQFEQQILIPKTTIDGETYYDIQIGHTWE